MIKVKGYIQALLAELENDLELDSKKDGRQLRLIMLTVDEWELLQDLITVLAPFEQATRHLGGEKYVTHSIMHPIVKEIKRLLLLPSTTSNTTSNTSLSNTPSNLSNNFENVEEVFAVAEEIEELENEDINNENTNNQRNSNRIINLDQPLNTEGMLDKVKKNLYDAMCFYWEFLPEDYKISTLLDPRIKRVNDDIENDEEILRQKYDAYQNHLPVPTESRPVSPTLSEYSTTQPSIFAIFEQDQPQVHDEISEYLKEDKIPFNQSPFEWWASKKNKYPLLAKIARIYLAVPATSTPSERLFSDAGNLLSAKRSRLNAEFFKRMIFLKRNAAKVNNIHQSY